MHLLVPALKAMLLVYGHCWGCGLQIEGKQRFLLEIRLLEMAPCVPPRPVNFEQQYMAYSVDNKWKWDNYDYCNFQLMWQTIFIRFLNKMVTYSSEDWWEISLCAHIRSNSWTLQSLSADHPRRGQHFYSNYFNFVIYFISLQTEHVGDATLSWMKERTGRKESKRTEREWVNNWPKRLPHGKNEVYPLYIAIWKKNPKKILEFTSGQENCIVYTYNVYNNSSTLKK